MDDLDGFPTYAELARTRGWAGGGPIPIAPPPAPSASGSLRYVEHELLGSGGMGKVMLARDARIGREVAVKMLHDRPLGEHERARFLREAQVQGQLEHPSIVPVYDIDHGPDGEAFFTMRRVLGKTLADLLDDLRAGVDRRPSERELLQAFATVCLAVDYAHSRGVIHRDLKPANIMLGDFGEVYVLDWGLARVLASSNASPRLDSSAERLSRPGMLLGTPLYAAPEQLDDPEVGPAADVFALGAILFEILTLQPLRDPRALHAPIEARPSVRAPQRELAAELDEICARATAADPAERYPSARALQEAIARHLDGDLEREQRHTLALRHAARARDALAAAPARHEVAMLELARALALDPTNIEHVATMAEVLRAPTDHPPPEIEQRLVESAQRMSRTGMRFAVLAMALWLAFLPALFALGVRRADYLIAAVAPVVVVIAIALVSQRRARISVASQYVTLAGTAIAGMVLSRVCGPLILMPTLATATTIILQTHPERRLRRHALIGGLLWIALPVVIEALGAAPASYDFTAGFAVIPQMVDFPREATIAFLLVAGLSSALVPSLFVARLRQQLTDSERRELIQTYRVRQLGDALLRAAH